MRVVKDDRSEVKGCSLLEILFDSRAHPRLGELVLPDLLPPSLTISLSFFLRKCFIAFLSMK